MIDLMIDGKEFNTSITVTNWVLDILDANKHDILVNGIDSEKEEVKLILGGSMDKKEKVNEAFNIVSSLDVIHLIGNDE